jgi:hypothetical protein
MNGEMVSNGALYGGRIAHRYRALEAQCRPVRTGRELRAQYDAVLLGSNTRRDDAISRELRPPESAFLTLIPAQVDLPVCDLFPEWTSAGHPGSDNGADGPAEPWTTGARARRLVMT